ncbi:cGMP-specific 3',5'-cGMP phosphodiesterase 3 [Bicyclus anynana]|uniref:cGMP-specific 3',5'-cGMP phosphodiesterase 3 n=1 Tax=Bicyclus anynana TaxID=110368 RepID=A0ABM3LW54_BICAN|nr:cGMP-specific 3',5'-cGMP phosphodiesterase 3 [Bicyclus anynana]
MGKRNKDGEQKVHVKTKKKRPEKDTLVNDDLTEEISLTSESTGNGKNKKIVFENDKSKLARVANDTEKHNVSSHNRNANNSTTSNEINAKNKTKQNKKIIFTDDNAEGVEITTNIPRSKKNARLKDSIDEEPADEEIDKFCDELDDEDNVQYDNWVKLIESQLCPKNKK